MEGGKVGPGASPQKSRKRRMKWEGGGRAAGPGHLLCVSQPGQVLPRGKAGAWPGVAARPLSYSFSSGSIQSKTMKGAAASSSACRQVWHVHRAPTSSLLSAAAASPCLMGGPALVFIAALFNCQPQLGISELRLP